MRPLVVAVQNTLDDRHSGRDLHFGQLVEPGILGGGLRHSRVERTRQRFSAGLVEIHGSRFPLLVGKLAGETDNFRHINTAALAKRQWTQSRATTSQSKESRER